jgi:hypothetical protein
MVGILQLCYYTHDNKYLKYVKNAQVFGFDETR